MQPFALHLIRNSLRGEVVCLISYVAGEAADQIPELGDASHRQSRRQHLPFASYERCLCATKPHNSLCIAFDNHSHFVTEELIHA
jgi:hypothetical protein